MAEQVIIPKGGGSGSAGSLPTVYEAVGIDPYVVAAGTHTMFTAGLVTMTLHYSDYSTDDIIHFSQDDGLASCYVRATPGELLDGRDTGRVRLVQTQQRILSLRLDATRGWIPDGDFSEAT